MITSSSLNRILDAADIVDVVSDFVQLTRKGSAYEGRCPFHQDSKPSLKVNPRLNRYKCFVCGASGDAIEFLREHCSMSFPEAVQWLGRKYGIEVKNDRREETDEERDIARRKESMWIANKLAQEFFIAQLQADTPEAIAARKYAYSRWPKEFCDEVGIGFAPRGNQAFLDFVKEKNLDRETLLTLGLLGTNHENGQTYVMYRERIVIPIHNRWGRVAGFTARYIGNNAEIAASRKYINSSKSLIFQKDSLLFGIHAAMRQARKTNCFIMVEGGPDVLRLQSIGLTEAVAPLGTALTQAQLASIKSVCKTIRFIPDSDPPKGKAYGAGVLAVMESGVLAMREGFSVHVKELPRTKEDDESEVKRDADSFITSREVYASLDSVPFPIWLAEKKFALASAPDEQIAVMQEIAALIVLIDDADMRDYILEQVKKIYGTPKQWKTALRRAGNNAKENFTEDNSDFSPKEVAMLRKFGIIVKDNMYYSSDKEGNLVRWSNFILRPVFHIKQKENATRVFRIINEYGHEDALEISQKNFSSVNSFVTAIESLGAYNWIVKQEQFTKLKEYLYAITDSAEEIPLLGYQKRYDFFAFANGIHDGSKFIPIDEHGIVRFGGKNFYLAPFSEMYKDDDTTFDFERVFTYKDGNDLSFYDFTSKIVEAFGEKGKVGVAWLLAAMYRDIIFKETTWFPMLNLYGIKGSGKTAFARVLGSFFYVLQKDPPQLGNTTVPGMSYIMSHLRNAPFIFDEYTNLLNDKLIALLKGVWGGIASTKMDTQSNRGIISAPVHCGIILCGQHKPDLDPALFSRVIHLYFPSPKFSVEQVMAFREVKRAMKAGSAHLSMELMRHREHFRKNFPTLLEITSDELAGRFGNEQPEERLLNNWAALLTTIRILETQIRLPFSFADFFDVVVRGIQYQQKEMDKSSETATFWSWLNSMHMVGKIADQTHFVIHHRTSFRGHKSDVTRQFDNSKPLLYLNWQGIKGLLQVAPQGMKMKMDAAMLENYLESNIYYLGEKQQRYNVLLTNGQPDYNLIPTAFGGTERQDKTVKPYAMVFDYELLKEQCKIDLETEYVRSNRIDTDEDDSDLIEPVAPVEPSPVAPPSPQGIISFAEDDGLEDAPF